MFSLSSRLLPLALLALGVSSAPTANITARHNASLPAASVETQVGFFTWSNIRYAQPPTGQLRWQPPQTPLQNRSYIQDGSDRAQACPQARPQWEFDLASVVPNDSFYSNFIIPPESEDCLFLNVHVPTKVWQNKDAAKAPVLFWMFGGGFVEGSKTSEGNPPGLIQTSGGEMIVVTINYRLGALDWMSGPSFESNPMTSDDDDSAAPGTANAGLLDQRFAMQWVQQYIHLFGGDKNRVTIMGESAGGASITHHITAYAGGPTGDGKEVEVPFQQAIVQSPGWYPISSNQYNEEIYDGFLNATGCGDLACLRGLSEAEAIAANNLTIWGSIYGSYTYGPVPDGSIVPAFPGELLRKGKFNRQVKLMIGHNINEAKYYAPPGTNTEADFSAFVAAAFPFASTTVKSAIETTLYPSSAYASSQQDRAAQLESDFVFACNTRYLANAFGKATYNYLFAYDDAFHGNDVPYTFYDPTDPESVSGQDAGVAAQLQGYIVSFVVMGVPEAPGAPPFPVYGGNSSVRVINDTAPVDVVDPAANERCDFWQLALYQ